MSRFGDFTNKRLIYKFYRNGMTSAQPYYVKPGLYNDATFKLNSGIYQYAVYSEDDTNSYLHVQTTFSSDGGTTDGVLTLRRRMYLKNLNLSFQMEYRGSVSSFYLDVLGYRISLNATATTISVSYGGTSLYSGAYSSSMSTVTMKENGGVVTITLGSTTITHNNNNDTSGNLSLGVLFSATYATYTYVHIFSLVSYPTTGGLIGSEIDNIGDFSLTTQINTPATSASLKLPYRPQDIPDYIAVGNFVEVYVSLEDLGTISYEKLLDENGIEIHDSDDKPIYTGTSANIIPEERDILKFAGYIESIDLDYADNVITLNLVSHGESLSNIILTSGVEVDTTVISQTAQNASESVDNRRQTFMPKSNLNVSGVRMRLSCNAGGSAYLQIGLGSTVVATSNMHVWNGSLAESVLSFEFTDTVLELNKLYWLKVVYHGGGYLLWYYNNSSVYDDGARQTLSGSTWSDTNADAYFEIYSTNEETTFTYSGTITNLVNKIFSTAQKALAPLSVNSVDEPGYNVSVSTSVDTLKTMAETALKLSPTGYWWRLEPGSGEFYLKGRPTEAEHIFALGRDFTEFTLNKSISEIKNDVLFIGADINQDGGKLAIRTTDYDSIEEYKRGLEIVTNTKVSRYDSAQLLSNYEISSNSKPRYTTSLKIPASLYNIETINIGDLVKVVNTDNETLADGLQVAQIAYTPEAVTLSLDSAPVTVNATVDKLKRDLENSDTSSVNSVI